MGTLSAKNMKRRKKRATRNAHRYFQTTHPARGGLLFCYKWNFYDNSHYPNYDYTQNWISFFEEKGILIVNKKFPKTFPQHLFNVMKINKKKFPQLCFSA
jgi:hypothetical protein